MCVLSAAAAAATIFYMVRANDGQLLFLCLAQDFHIGRRFLDGETTRRHAPLLLSAHSARQ